MTAREALRKSIKLLEAEGVAEAEAKAKIIVSHVLGVSLSQVYSGEEVPEHKLCEIEHMTGRCAAREPVEYVTGKAYFRYLTLDVNPGVLIPRKETELVAGKAIELIIENGYQKALDMCTGSGCIAVSLAGETVAHIDAADISEAALESASRNALLNGVIKNICFLRSDIFENIKDTYDIIVCNPPYVSEEEYLSLDDSVRLFEPKAALLAGDGLEFYRRIAADAPYFLYEGGALVLEIGASQAPAVKELLRQGGFADIECQKDYAGRDRIVTAIKGARNV